MDSVVLEVYYCYHYFYNCKFYLLSFHISVDVVSETSTGFEFTIQNFSETGFHVLHNQIKASNL